jgi:stage II sporulation protein M
MKHRNWLFLAASIFFIGLMVGLFLPSNWPNGQLQSLQNTANSLQGKSSATLFVYIFMNNLASLLTAFLFAPLLLISPVIYLLTNGAILSVVGVDVSQSHSVRLFLAGVLPHGVIGIPAFIIGNAAAMSFGFAVIMGVISPSRRVDIIPAFKQKIRWLGLAALLLIPAAFIEAFITQLPIKAVS